VLLKQLLLTKLEVPAHPGAQPRPLQRTFPPQRAKNYISYNYEKRPQPEPIKAFGLRSPG